MTVRIIQGDCRAVLRTLPDESVQCVVTSPPYWGLRAYGVGAENGELGLEATFGAYIDSMVGVFREVRRVLRGDGTLWLNLGDSYATGAGKVGGAPGGGEQGARWAGYRGSHGKVNSGKASYRLPEEGLGPMSQPNRMPQAGLKPKDLVGIPWRVAFALQADGWWLRQDIIWAKPNPMPESVTDRCTKSHEYLFLLAKSETYHYDAEAIAEPVTASTVARMSQPSLDDQHASDRVPGKTNGPMKAVLKGRASGNKTHKGVTEYEASPDEKHRTKAGLLDIADIAYQTRNKRDVWTVATMPFSEAHFATFPPALIEPCILAGCPKGGVVLDPFLGAGTTALVADRLERDCIGIELNPEYAAMAERRVRGDSPLFAKVTA